MKNIPFISIIIPCRNEEKFIGNCLNSIIDSYPRDRMEILVIDGMSQDKTSKILKKYSQKYFFIKVFDNFKKITPCALNIGVKNSKGSIIVRLDAHAKYRRDYILKSVKYLKMYNADNVGGIIRTLPKKNTLSAKAIACVLSHDFGVGNSYFRRGSKKPRQVDTVFGGCYKKEIFKKIGFFNENLVRSQDIELNLRLKRSGGKILLFPDIIAYYYTKSNIKNFFLYNFNCGIWATYHLKFVKKIFCFRHYLPLVFVLILLSLLILGIFINFFMFVFLFIILLYLCSSFFIGFKVALQEKKWQYIIIIPFVFWCRHFGYGIGSLIGIFKICL